MNMPVCECVSMYVCVCLVVQLQVSLPLSNSLTDVVVGMYTSLDCGRKHTRLLGEQKEKSSQPVSSNP